MPSPVSRWCLRSGVAVVPAAIAVSLVSVPAFATSPKDLKAQVAKLNDQLEKLTEQYNGLNVQLKNSQAAATVAQDQATAANASLGAIQSKLKQIAATTYMHDGSDDTSWASMVTAPDPTTLLGNSAALQYVTSQKNVQVTSLLTAAQQAARASSTAKTRQTEVQALQKQIGGQKSKIQDLLAKNKAKLSGGSSGGSGGSAVTTAPATPSGGASAKALAAVAAAKTKLGRPYVYGAAGPSTFDCSGLTRWAYAQVGISLDHFTGSQINEGTRIATSAKKPGDLVFFYSDHHHVGMYIGDDKMIDAPHTGTVVQIQSLANRTITAVVRVA